MKKRLAGRARCVEALLQQKQIHALAMELGEKADEVLQRAAEAINRPSGDQVKFLAGDGTAQLVKTGALIAGVLA